MTFKFPVEQQLSSVSLLKDRGADYLKGLHATITARVINADNGMECYVMVEYFYANDTYAGDMYLRPAAEVDAKYIPFVKAPG